MSVSIARLSGFLKQGPRHVTKRLLNYVVAARAGCAALAASRLRGRSGIEIGGPSGIFERRNLLPVYPVVGSIDNYTFHISGSSLFGKEVRCAGATLPLPDAACDFVLSSHVLEHMANPLLALSEWRRVLKPDGCLLAVLPHGPQTFDRRRPITTLEHLVGDLKNGTPEDDLTHAREAFELQEPEEWGWSRKDYRNNAESRWLHHHVFDERLAVEAISHAGFRVLASELAYPYHIIVFADLEPAG